eukprot:6482237-Amphidinium_carterae.1
MEVERRETSISEDVTITVLKKDTGQKECPSRPDSFRSPTRAIACNKWTKRFDKEDCFPWLLHKDKSALASPHKLYDMEEFEEWFEPSIAVDYERLHLSARTKELLTNVKSLVSYGSCINCTTTEIDLPGGSKSNLSLFLEEVNLCYWFWCLGEPGSLEMCIGWFNKRHVSFPQTLVKVQKKPAASTTAATPAATAGNKNKKVAFKTSERNRVYSNAYNTLKAALKKKGVKKDVIADQFMGKRREPIMFKHPTFIKD